MDRINRGKLEDKYRECFGIEFGSWFLNLETSKVDGKIQRDKCLGCPVFQECHSVVQIKSIGSQVESNHILSTYLCEVISFFAKSEKEVLDKIKEQNEAQNDPDNQLPPDIREWKEQQEKLGDR